MDDCENTTSRQHFSGQASVKLGMETAHSTSNRSQNSASSVKALGSSSIADAPDRSLYQSGICDNLSNSVLSAESEVCRIECGNPDVRSSVNGSLQHWLDSDVMSSSVLPSDHHTTPGKEEDCQSAVSEEMSNISERECRARELFMPGELHTPILGYETFEARSKFTIYKIHVQKAKSNVLPTSWFVFRRYSDFFSLNSKLKVLFPAFQLSLPPKRWLRNNFEKEFLDSRRHGLQLFLDNVTGHRDMCNSEPVRDFLCTDDPPGPHDNLQESRALCDMLEECVYNLRQQLQNRDSEMSLLKEELTLYRSQVDLLSKQLRLLNKRKNGGGISSSASGSVDNLDSEQCSSRSVQDSGQDGQAHPSRM